MSTPLDEAVAIAVQMARLRGLAVKHGRGTVAIEKAYRELAMLAHPDRGGDPAIFRQLTAARDTMVARMNNVERATHGLFGVKQPGELH
jgi:hypothetical protein